MELYSTVVSLIGLFLFSLVLSFLPRLSVVFLNREDPLEKKKWFSYLTYFSCALVVTTGISHVLPNAIDAFNYYRMGWGYPYPLIIISFVILLCWCIEIYIDKKNNRVDVAYDICLVDSNDELPPANPYLFTIGLYFHSVLEGLVLGSTLFGDDVFYMLLLVLSIHKGCEGFALGTIYESYEHKIRSKISLLILFCILTPLGIGLGILLTISLEGIMGLIVGIMCSICAGMFIYTGISLIIAKNTPSYTRTNYRLLFVALGFSVAGIIAYFA